MQIVKYIMEEIKVIRKNDPAIKTNWEVILYPSFIAILWYRLSHYLYIRNHFFLARYISEMVKRKTGIEIHPGAIIGKGVFIDHGTGVVIGQTAIVGNNVKLFHGVTLGGIKNMQGKRHPTVEDNVMIGTGAKILGNILIGENSKIGANAVVLHDVPANATVVGMPGKVVKINGKEIEDKN